MDDTHAKEDALLNAAAATGGQRNDNVALVGTSVVRPQALSAQVGLEMYRRQSEVLSPAELRVYYIHLLMRSCAFLEFVQENVGSSADYPLRLRGDSNKDLEEFQLQLRELRDAAGVLVEM